jgi:hypothetical protein
VTDNLPARRQQAVSLDDITDLDQALRFCDVISQSGLLPAAQRGRYLLARLRKAGHDYWWEETSDSCTFFIKRGDNPRTYSAAFTITDAL